MKSNVGLKLDLWLKNPWTNIIHGAISAFGDQKYVEQVESYIIFMRIILFLLKQVLRMALIILLDFLVLNFFLNSVWKII